MPIDPPLTDAACAVVAALRRQGATVAAAESLTGGSFGAALTAVPGSSAVFRGAIVAYATDLKASLLGVPADLLAEAGPVDAGVAGAMAVGARERLGATWGVALTGVAGPEPQAGKPPGTVWIAVSGAATTRVQLLELAGARDEIRRQSVRAALLALVHEIGGQAAPAPVAFATGE